MKISICFVLGFACLMSPVNGQLQERQTRDLPRRYCDGRELAEVLYLTCQPSRGKRHAMVAKPSNQMSPFMMNLYRPSIENEDKWVEDWALRVRILKTLLGRIRDQVSSTIGFQRSQEPTRAFKSLQEHKEISKYILRNWKLRM